MGSKKTEVIDFFVFPGFIWDIYSHILNKMGSNKIGEVSYKF